MKKQIPISSNWSLRWLPASALLFVWIGTSILEYGRTEWKGFEFLNKMEWASFDWRIRKSLASDRSISDHLAFVGIDDHSLELSSRKLTAHLDRSWPWPRWFHAIALKELKAQGATGIAYDIFFSEIRPTEFAPGKGGKKLPSDAYFAQEMRKNGAVTLGVPHFPSGGDRAPPLRLPASIFAESSAAMGHAVMHRDSDGVARRVKPFIDTPEGDRIWQLGIVMAAQTLGLELEKAIHHGNQLHLPKGNGDYCILPIDSDGFLLIRWALPWSGKHDRMGIPSRPIESLFADAASRSKGIAVAVEKSPFSGRSVIIGSTGTSPAISDRGVTSVAPSTPYVSVHWNVANSIITSNFVHQPSTLLRLGILGALVTLVGFISWQLRATWGAIVALTLAFSYLLLCTFIYAKKGVWLPLVVPILGAVFVNHGLMGVFRIFYERRYRGRLRGAFSRIVSPTALEQIINEPHLSRKAEEREMTVLFADIRGFTALTDTPETRNEEAFQLVSEYLAAVAEAVLEEHGTIDKYMGDCVMAFWGAPLKQPDHAIAAVRAGIRAQQALKELNRKRCAQNLKGIHLGIGINSGLMTVGFMGAKDQMSNYTVFGREVNIAARVEAQAGPDQILVTEETYRLFSESEPDLGSAFPTFGEVTVKGIQRPILLHSFEYSKNSQTFLT